MAEQSGSIERAVTVPALGLAERRRNHVRRKVVNSVMFATTGVCTMLVISVLFIILGYLFWNGGRYLDWNFFTKLPAPVGESGGGMANAIIGSAKLLGIATLIGVPIGFFG